MKKKISISIEEDAYDLLKIAAETESLSVSEMAERSIRYICGDYVSHRITVARLTDVEGSDSAAVTVERRGQPFFERTPLPRHEVMSGVDGEVIVDLMGPIVPDQLAKLIEALPAPSSEEVRSGRAVTAESAGVTVRVVGIRLGVEGSPDYVVALRRYAATAIRNELELVSFRDVSLQRCSTCGTFVVRKRVWAPAGERPEVEWICAVGHRTSGGLR